jgi:hypothetical protein
VTALLNFLTDELVVHPWPDEVIDRQGFDPRSPYVEQFWLGVLGPSTTWLLRRLAAGFDASPDGFAVSLGETARALGLGDRSGRHSPFLRTVNRMVQFELARPRAVDELEVRRRLPPLARRHAARLSPALQAAHARWQEEQLLTPLEDTQRRRGRQLALSLLELGEDPESTERQLLRWGYHPTIAHDATTWALERQVDIGVAILDAG